MPAWAADLVVALLVVGSAFAPSERAAVFSFDPLRLGLCLAAALVLPLRRRWPRATVAAVLGLAAVGFLLGAANPTTLLPTAIAVFGLATRVDRRTTVITALVSVGVITVVAVVAFWGGGYLDFQLVQILTVIGFAAAAGDGLKARRAYVQAIVDRAERAERTRESEAMRRVAEERLRIARDLHDTVAHQIAVINLQAGAASAALAGARADDAEASLATIRAAAREVLADIGGLLTMLRTEGDGAAESGSLSRLDDLVGRFRSGGIDVTVRVEGSLDAVPPAVDRVAAQVISEALTNAHKHGAEGRAHLLVRVDPDELAIVVTNPVDEVALDARGTGHGLLGVRERVAAVHGRVEAATEAGSVFVLRMAIPLDGDGGGDGRGGDGRGHGDAESAP